MPRKEAAKGGSSGGKKGKEAATPAAAAAPAPVEPKPKRLKVNLPGGATVTAAPVPEAVAARLGEFEQRRRELVDQLRETEKQIFELESRYLELSNPNGNALKGYEGLLATGSGAKKAQLTDEDRLFSGSSLTGRRHVR